MVEGLYGGEKGGLTGAGNEGLDLLAGHLRLKHTWHHITEGVRRVLIVGRMWENEEEDGRKGDGAGGLSESVHACGTIHLAVVECQGGVRGDELVLLLLGQRHDG